MRKKKLHFIIVLLLLSSIPFIDGQIPFSIYIRAKVSFANSPEEKIVALNMTRESDYVDWADLYFDCASASIGTDNQKIFFHYTLLDIDGLHSFLIQNIRSRKEEINVFIRALIKMKVLSSNDYKRFESLIGS